MDSAASAAQPVADPAAPVPHRRWVLAAAMLAMFMTAVEATIVATAMPTIVAELGGFRLYSWVFAIYLLTQAVTIPIYGKLADMLGRKPVFYLGASLFLAGSILAGLSQGMVPLIAFRALQGLGGGAIQPVALTIIGDIYTAEERARIQGLLSSVWGLSSIFGPALGAFLVQVHWALVFWVNVPIGIAAMAMLGGFLHEGVRRQLHQVDYLGSALLMTGTTALMLALIQGQSLSGLSLAVWIAVAGVCLAGFLVQERRAAEPMMPLGLWRRRIIATGNAGSLVTGAVMIGVTSFLPAYVQGVMGRTPAVAGFVLATMSTGWAAASTLGGRLMVRTSYRLSALLGGASLIAGSALLALLRPEDGPLRAAAGAILIGAGMGFTSTTYLVSIQASVSWNERGVATSSNLFMRMVGAALGAAVLGAVLNSGLAHTQGGADAVNRMMQPESRALLEPGQLASLIQAMAEALRNVYAIAGVLSAIALGLALSVPRGLKPGR